MIIIEIKIEINTNENQNLNVVVEEVTCKPLNKFVRDLCYLALASYSRAALSSMILR